MSGVFKYSLLKYVHSDLLGEYLNVGILFYFPNSDSLRFLFPRSLSRLKDLYKDHFSEKLILATLKTLSQTAKDRYDYQRNNSLNFLGLEFADLQQWLLPLDSTALRFGSTKTAVIYGQEEVIMSDYFNMYFSYFESTASQVKRKDEEFISKKVRGILKEKDSEYQRFILSDPEVSAPILPDGKFSFDFSWNNHVTHYVKPISFDLLESKSINTKAAQYYGYLSALADQIGEDTVDILTTRPQNRSLWVNYDKALTMIDRVLISKKIVQQAEYETYAQNLLDNAESRE
jgi:hypothetical protein